MEFITQAEVVAIFEDRAIELTDEDAAYETAEANKAGSRSEAFRCAERSADDLRDELEADTRAACAERHY